MPTVTKLPPPSPIILWQRKLRNRKCEPVSVFGPELGATVDRLRSTCRTANGMGLAAPQIGEFVRAAVIYCPYDKELVLINPIIDEINSKGEQTAYEACLSIPTPAKVAVNVRRCMKIIYSYQDMDGKLIEAEADGILARAIQHEVDHLNGVFYIDRIGELSRSLVMRQFLRFMDDFNKHAPYSEELSRRYRRPDL